MRMRIKSQPVFWLSLLLAAALAAGLAWAYSVFSQPAAAPIPAHETRKHERVYTGEDVSLWPADAKDNWTGRLVRVEKHLALLTVRGSPQERGTAHGKLLKEEVRALVKSVRAFVQGDGQFDKCLDGAKTMRKYIDPDVLAEMDACALAAEAAPDELLLAHLFGDVNRALKVRSYCSSFAAFGPATSGGKLIVGRNFDYGGHGLEGGLPLILQEIPAGDNAGRPFVTIGYAGILNGWTAMNADGLCASNNTLFSGVDSLEGMATCFLLRKIVERAKTVEEGVAILEHTPRACTTGMLIAGKNNAGLSDARLVEFDAKTLAIVEPVNSVVLGTNTRQKLAVGNYEPEADPCCTRYQTLKKLLRSYAGKLSFDEREQKTAEAKGVYMSINLHCALLEPESQRLRVAVKEEAGKPAAEGTFRTFRVKQDEISVLP